MSGPREPKPAQPRVADTAARILSVLLITASDDLEGFRKRLLGKKSTVPIEVLEAALDILARLGEALLSEDEMLHQRVLAARDALHTDVETVAEPTAAADDDVPSMPARLDAPAAPPSPPAGPPPVPPRPAPPPPVPVSGLPKTTGSVSPWAARPASPPPPAAPPPPAQQPAPAPPERPAPLPDKMARTAVATSLPDGPALPFQGQAAPPKPAAADLEPLPEGSLHGTAHGDRQSPFAGKDLPFRQSGDPPGSQHEDQPPPSVTRTELLTHPEPDGGSEPTERLRLDRHAPAAGAEPDDDAATRVATAVSSGQPGRSASMTLEDYAVLSAEASVFPERIAAIRQKYGVPTEEAHHDMDARWQARFRVEPELRAQYDELVAGFAAFLRRDKH